MDPRSRMGKVRSDFAGHEQMHRGERASAQDPSRFKRHECTETVAKKCERPVQQWTQYLCQGFNQRRHSFKAILTEAGSASGKLGDTQLNRVVQSTGPSTENSRARACIGKANQAQ